MYVACSDVLSVSHDTFVVSAPNGSTMLINLQSHVHIRVLYSRTKIVFDLLKCHT